MSESQRAGKKQPATSTGGKQGEPSLLSSTPVRTPLTSLIGRESEVAEVAGLLTSGQARLLTLVGPGGVGKTRLALHIAASVQDRFADGVYFIPLASVSNSDLVLTTIAQTLGIPEASGETVIASLCAALRDRHLLLILDNFEQIVAAGPHILDLLLCAQGLSVLVTSRAVLKVYGESEYSVSTLAVPDASRQESLEQLTRYEAVRLFIERAQAAKRGFAVTNRTAPAVAEICHRLDGLPLAIELAASRIKLLSPQALLARLGSRLPLLTQGATSLPFRHQTLRNAIAWSYNLLDADEQRFFRSLSVFVGGCTLETVEAICTPGAQDTLNSGREGASQASIPTFDMLATLIDKSLLYQDEQVTGDDYRFFMLETIREFASEELAASSEEEVIRARHAQYFMGFAERADVELVGANQSVWLDNLAQDHDNLRAALAWAQRSGDAGTGLRIAAALWRFWYVRGYLSEGQGWLSSALAQVGPSEPAARAKALNGLGNMAYSQGDHEAARRYYEQGLAISRETGNLRSVAGSLSNLGNIARLQGDLARSRLLYEQSLEICRDTGHDWGAATALHNLSVVSWEQGDYEQARTIGQRGLLLRRKIGEKSGLAGILNSMGEIALSERDYPAARGFLEECLALSREIGDKIGISRALYTLGDVLADQGAYSEAFALQSDSLRLRYELGSKRGVAQCLHGLASLDREQVDPRRIVCLIASAEKLSAAIGFVLPAQTRARYEPGLEIAQEKLGPEAAAAAWREGESMTMEEAVALALQSTKVESALSKDEAISKSVSDLTTREVEVLRLITAGLTNPAIAAHLHVTINTVQTHVKTIFSKTNVNTRAAAVRYAFEHNLS